MIDEWSFKVIVATLGLSMTVGYLFWLKKRMQERRQNCTEQYVRLVGTLNLSMKERVVVVEIAHHQLVLGLNGDHIVVLANLQVKPDNQALTAACLKSDGAFVRPGSKTMTVER